jgi:protein-L-isoaspartate(D-aspartate) O-methyltransferase
MCAMDRFAGERHRMVQVQIKGRGLNDRRLLAAFDQVPRHLFVPLGSRAWSYDDRPLPIGFGQTISQPYIVALMSDLAELQGTERVLEVGTGSGYQAAILACLAAEVHTVEIIPELAHAAGRCLARLKCSNVHVHRSDGSIGWPRAAPYEAILVTAAAPSIPAPLLEELAEGGRMVLPVEHGDGYQMLTVLRRREGKITEKMVASVAFVPLRGLHGWQQA